MKWILNKARLVRVSLVFISLCSIVYSLFGVFFAFVSKRLIDVATKNAEGNLLHLVFLLVFMMLFELVLQMADSLVSVKAKGKLLINCREGLYKTILKKDYASSSKFHSGDILNRINGDFSVVVSGIMEIIPDLLMLVTRIVPSFAAVLYLDFVFGIICIAMCPVIFISSRIYGGKMKQLHKKCRQAEGNMLSYMQETLKNILIIKSFGCEEEMTARGTELQNTHFGYTIKRNYINIIVSVMYYIVITMGYYFALGWGAYKISMGIMTFGTLTALLQLVGQIQTPFRSLAALIPRYYSVMASAERVREIEALKDDTINYLTDEECKNIYNKTEKISVKNICFKYEEDYILKDFTLDINKGEFVVISGTSGIGKSTLLKILLGIYKPESGTVELCTKDGEIKMTAEMRRMFAYVPQGNMILSGTIKENIALAKEGATDEEIKYAAKVAGISGYIESLPNGYDTVLGEDGTGLSEGQIQRLAIARAILFDAPVLLLDEATSSLDEKTELLLLENIKALKNKTCIIVSHRDAAKKFCDKNIVF